jgi:hypothetical protein
VLTIHEEVLREPGIRHGLVDEVEADDRPEDDVAPLVFYFVLPFDFVIGFALSGVGG